MSAWAEHHAAPPAVRWSGADERLTPLWMRLLTFFVATALAALAYQRLLFQAPVGPALAVAAVATVCGGALSLSLVAVGGVRTPETSPLRTRALRAVVTVVVVLLGLELG